MFLRILKLFFVIVAIFALVPSPSCMASRHGAPDK